MNWRKLLIAGALPGFGVWLGLAQAGEIFPTDLSTKMTVGGGVTVSLYQRDDTLPTAVTQTSPSRCTRSSAAGTPYYKDVTDCWLPEWSPAGGKEVIVVVNGSATPPTLVLPGTTVAPGAGSNPFLAGLTTSAYPGKCTNFGLASDTGADFTLGGAVTRPTSATTSVTGYVLTPNDCGGMAVIQVGGASFILPKDGSATVAANGIPDVWETLHGGTIDPAADDDIGPSASTLKSDGIAAFDEYRGFIESGRQTRSDPRQKDLFVHVANPADSVNGVFVTSADCGASCYGGGTATYPAPAATSATLTVPATALTSGAVATFTAGAGVFSRNHVRGEIVGNAGGRARIVEVLSSTSAKAEITQPFPSATTLSATSWKLSESLFALVYTLVAPERLHLLGYMPGRTNAPVSDEWTDNFVSLVPAQTLNISNSITDRIINSNRLYGLAQKGVRVMEGLNVSSSSVLGWSFGVASPNQAGNVVVYTQRILNYLNGLLATATAGVKYSTASIVNGAWTWSAPVAVTPDFIRSKAFQFYTGHEIHHSLNLTPDVQGTSKTSYGHHFAPGTGDCLDQAITTTSKSSVVTFYIPSICGTADETSFIIR